MKAYTSPCGNTYETIELIRERIEATKGRIFRVLFVSRAKLVGRLMRARLKRLDPSTRLKDHWNHQVTVWDMDLQAWRTVPLDRVVHFKCGDEEWVTKCAEEGR